MNEDPKDALMKKYQQEIEELRRLLEEGSEGSSAEDGGVGDDGEQVFYFLFVEGIQPIICFILHRSMGILTLMPMELDPVRPDSGQPRKTTWRK